MLNIFTQQLRDICEKLLSDPYVLFLVTGNSSQFFDESKIPTSVLCRIPEGTFIPSLVPTGQVLSEEKSFEKLLMDDIDNGGCQVIAIAHMTFG